MDGRPRLPSTLIGALLFPDAILKAEFEANAPLRGNGYQGRSYLISLISHRASQCSSPRRPYVHATALASKGTRLTVHILAAVAEHEREMISERTKAALAAAKRRGQRLGKPNLTDVAKRGTATGKANARRFAANVHPIIEEIMSGELAKLRQRVGDNQPTTLRKPLEVCPGFGQSEPSPPILQFATSDRLTFGTNHDYKGNIGKRGPDSTPGFFCERLADHHLVFGLPARQRQLHARRSDSDAISERPKRQPGRSSSRLAQSRQYAGAQLA